MKKHVALWTGLLMATLTFADEPPPGTGYKSVADALTALKQMKDVSFSTVRGWTIVTDETHLTVWSFAPKTDPSYPAVVKRMVTSGAGGSKVTMSVLCEANKAACNNLVREFSNTDAHSPGAHSPQ